MVDDKFHLKFHHFSRFHSIVVQEREEERINANFGCRARAACGEIDVLSLKADLLPAQRSIHHFQRFGDAACKISNVNQFGQGVHLENYARAKIQSVRQNGENT